jgi:type IV secretory pathway TraG/TraD family ATPase VirD4
MSLSYARGVAPEPPSPGEASIPFGGVPVSARSHVCLVGTTGSGKTEALKEILRAELPKIGRGPDSCRAVLYDPKTEFWGFARRLCPDVRTLHPFDRRGKSWGMCLDVRTPKAAGQFAATIIPPEDGPNSYFSNAARGILRGVVESFVLNTPDGWTFRDLILACESETRLRAALSRNDETRSVVANYLDVREATSIFSSLDTFLAPFRPVAACWSKADPLSLQQWVDGNFVLLLPQDESARDVLGRLNALCFQFLTEQLLARETNAQLEAKGQPRRGTVVCLDELRDIAKGLPGLTALLTRGRAYGVALRMGYQSQSGMQDALDRKAAELIGMCNYLGMLRVVERETAEYLSQTISDREVFRPSVSISEGGKSTSYQLSREPAVLPAAFSELPTETLSGYFLAPAPLGLWRADLPWPWKTRASETKETSPEPDFLPRDDAEQYLAPWTEEDLLRLKLPLSLLHQERRGRDRPDEHKRDTGPKIARPPAHGPNHGH